VEETTLTEELQRAEGLLIQNEDEGARELLRHLADDAEGYVDANCPTTEEVQWFSFPTIFERLAYRRVEDDPRELRDVGEPLDRLYADLALACARLGDFDEAREALKAAVRWNPMGCEYRLDLAELYRAAGDMDEYLALTYSVFERASEASHLSRAFLVFSNYFQRVGKTEAAAGALRVARRLDGRDPAVRAALDQATGTDADPDSISDQQATDALAAEGLPDGANAEIAICLLMCATDSAAAGDRQTATTLTLRARDLVGDAAAMTLLKLIRETDDELAGGEPSDA
jgi:tetratricopeptide (TPR) repeat protein